MSAREAFEEVRRGARGNLFSLDFYACLGASWSYAAERRWHDAELCLMHAEDLRYDVRLRDPEAETLRQTILALAEDRNRHDIIERVNKLDVLRSRTLSIQHSL